MENYAFYETYHNECYVKLCITSPVRWKPKKGGKIDDGMVDWRRRVVHDRADDSTLRRVRRCGRAGGSRISALS